MVLNEEQLRNIIEETAAATVRQMNLDNGISCAEDDEEGAIIMPSKVQKQITLSNGKKVVVRGKSIEDILRAALEKQDQPDAPTFEEYAQTWVNLYHDPKAGTKWKTETRYLLDAHILPYFGKKRLNEISVEDMQRFYNLKNSYSQSYIKHMKYIIHAILDSAIEDGLIGSNVVDSKRLSFSNKKEERQPLSEDQIESVIAQLKELNPNEQLLMALLIYTGMRRGEVLALQWKDIDLENNVIHVTKSVEFVNENNPRLKPPKSQAGIRDIPIIPALYPYLEHKGEADIFLVGNNTEPLTKRAYDWMFGKIRKKINLYGATPHSLRHTFITAAAGKLDPKQLQEIAGHSKCDITLNRYAHTKYKNTAETAKNLSDLYVRSF